MSEWTKEEVLKTLRNNPLCVVTFQKIDGEIRTLYCTLYNERIPQPVARDNRLTNPNVVAAWDVDIGEWRAFRVNSIKSLNVVGYGSCGEEVIN